MTTVALISQKGGVGKTTIAVNLSYSLAKRGWRVLLVDADIQGGVGFSLTERAKNAVGFHDFLLPGGYADRELSDAVIHTNLPELDLLVRGSRESLDDFLVECGAGRSLSDRASDLTDQLSRLDYDVVLFDTATGIGGTALGICREVDYIVVPERPEPLCIRTLPQILRVVAASRAEKAENEGPRLAGILMALADPDDSSSLEDQKEFRDLLPGDLVFDTVIPEHRDFREASRVGVPVAMLRQRPSPSSLVFDRLAAEMEDRIYLYDDPGDSIDDPEDYARLVD